MSSAAQLDAAGCGSPTTRPGDCHLFTRQLADRAAALGVRFAYGSVVSGLELEGGRMSAVHLGDARVLVA